MMKRITAGTPTLQEPDADIVRDEQLERELSDLSK
jgi:hypothetical protein